MSDDDDSEEEVYSVKSSQTIYKRSRSRTNTVATSRESEYRSLPRIVVRSHSDERYESDDYRPVQKWAVDYNNKNFVRSLCNKNTGSHRKVRGRPLIWQIEYDNSYFTRSKVNAPKGLHRKVPDIKRKYFPDDDDLADATGWEFDYGPEFDQVEQDVTYMPEGRIIRRGCYRWYGVKRNDSDCDLKMEEQRENLLNEELEEELKCGHEFLQSDVPHLMSEKPDRRYTRGSYRHYEVPRNAYDIDPDELASAKHDPEWKRKHHSNGFRYLDLDMCKYDREDIEDHHKRRGKPFKRTILNKVYELRKEEDPEDRVPARRGTRISLIPGEGEKTLYEGVPDRFPFKSKRTPSIRSVFKKKSERQKYRSTDEGEEIEQYKREDTEHRYLNPIPKYEERQYRMTDENHGRVYDPEDSRKGGSERFHEYAYRVKEDEHKAPRRHSTSTSGSSYRDMKENFETWRDNAINANREKGFRNQPEDRSFHRRKTYKDDEYSTSDETEQDFPRKYPTAASNKKNPRHVKEEFETWRDNVKNAKLEDDRNFKLKRPQEQRKRSFRDSDHPSTNQEQDSPRKYSTAASNKKNPTRVKEEFETWRDNVKNAKLEEDDRNFKLKRQPEHRKRSFRDSDHPSTNQEQDFSRKYSTAASNKKDPTRVKEEFETWRDVVGKKGNAKDYEYANRHGSKYARDDYDHRGTERKDTNRVRSQKGYTEDLSPDEENGLKKLPPHVKERMEKIRQKMIKKLENIDHKLTGKGVKESFDISTSIEDSIDFMKHKDHPHDKGHTHNSKYEKYVKKNGSELWVQSEEKIAELHHKSH